MEAPLSGYELIYTQPTTHKMIVWGGTCMSFQEQQRKKAVVDSATLVVGTEGGAIFRCLLGSGAGQVDAGQKYRSPVKADFAGHAGPACAVACSPFHRSLFLSAGTDATIKIFNMLYRQPILELEPCDVSYLQQQQCLRRDSF